MSLLTDTGRFSDSVSERCSACGKPDERCQCYVAPASGQKDWTVAYWSPALGRKVYGGPMTRKGAEGWVAVMRHGRRQLRACALRALPMIRCSESVAPTSHDGPMQPARELIGAKR